MYGIVNRPFYAPIYLYKYGASCYSLYMNTNTPPTIKGAIGAAGKEIANVGQAYSNATKSLQNAGSKIPAGIKAMSSIKPANPFSLKGMYKKAKRK